MALVQFNYMSGALQRHVPVQVVLPVDKLTPDGKLMPEKKFKRTVREAGPYNQGSVAKFKNLSIEFVGAIRR